jgi:four helix bundle protein
MTEVEMKDRTKAFALRVLKLIEALPNTRTGRIIADQLGRAGSSVGANYRAVCRSRSVAEMVSRLSVVEEEADESAFWLEMTADGGALPRNRLDDLHREASELTAIMVASRKTLLAKNRKSKIENRK